MFVLGTLAAGPALAQGPIDYLREVKPILAARCYACHGALKQESELRLDTAAAIRKGGQSGPAIELGKSRQSLLMERVMATDAAERMPPESEGAGLQPHEIGRLAAWIDQDGPAPAEEESEPDPRDHWAFRAPVSSPVPLVSGAAGSEPIDAFIAAEHQARGLRPQPPASRRILLRRVHLDLVGLPPSRAEQEAFLADPAPDAYEKVVDRLLASPSYGERWGRHWMDIWRYSDWWGLGPEVRNSQKHIWHWRDWIIDSLNSDKGYDEMLREMLAADELFPNDLDRLRGTGYLARHYFRFNRNTWLDETIEHTGKAVLGLTLNCAKCHDHKFDPIPQTDYYRLRAFFEPYQVRTDQLPGQPDLEKDGLPRVFDCNLDAPTYRFERGDEKRPRKDQPIPPGLPAILVENELVIEPVLLPAQAHSPGLRPFVLEDHVRAAQERAEAAKRELERARTESQSGEEARLARVLAEKVLAAAQAEIPALLARAAADRARHADPGTADAAGLAQAACRAERSVALAKAHEQLARAERDAVKAAPDQKEAANKAVAAARQAVLTATQALETKSDQYTPLRGSLKAPESNLETDASRQKPYPGTSTGRRAALARWLTDPRHPLTARVAVNHIWARHLGRPLVPTVFDFGRKGAAPTHPALLDFLARELIQTGWSMKQLHRSIVTSHTYRMTSSARAGAQAPDDAGPSSQAAVDPENRYYWRMNPVRMEAQVVRDGLLHVSDQLDRTMGGPSIPVSDESSRRRSLYFVHSHNDHQKFLAIFDDANVLECYRRAESIIPQQALALSNSQLAIEMAEKISSRLEEVPGRVSDADFIEAAFEAVLGFEPSDAERAECQEALGRLVQLHREGRKPDPVRRARERLVHALLNHNDFITIR